MKLILIALLLVVVAYIGFTFFTSGSAQEPKTNAPQTNLSEAKAVTDGSYTAVPEESTMNWEGRKTLIANYKDTGTIKIKEGSLTVAGAAVTGKFTIDMTSIAVVNTGKGPMGAGLEKHLKSDSFFNTEKFPTAEFEIINTQADAKVNENHQYTVTGKLTMKGITNEITFPAQVFTQDGKLHAHATMEIDRTKWDIRYGSDKFFDNLANNVIDDNFTLAFHLVAKQN